MATRFSCLVKLSYDYSFDPVWRPRFVSDIVPEDRCHLNGLAVREGRPRYATALGMTDAPGAWRERKADGGVLIDVESDEVVLVRAGHAPLPRWQGENCGCLTRERVNCCKSTNGPDRAEVVAACPAICADLAFKRPYALNWNVENPRRHISAAFGAGTIRRAKCGVAGVNVRDGSQTGFFEFPQDARKYMT